MTIGKLAGKVALITGAGRGIGREIALRLAGDGADIVVHYSGSEAGTKETARAICDLGRTAVTVRADIGQRSQVKAMFAEMDKAFDRLDIVVNCAGTSGGGTLADLDDDMLAGLLGVNFYGPLYVASEAAKQRGGWAKVGGSSISPRPPQISHLAVPAFIRARSWRSKASPKPGPGSSVQRASRSIASYRAPPAPACSTRHPNPGAASSSRHRPLVGRVGQVR